MKTAVRRWLLMMVLSLSAGIIFLLPFLREVFYKPMAVAMGLSNTELGVMMGAFGITSMITYFPGGWLADRVSPRKLLTYSLLATGLTGLYFATFPGYEISVALHGFWGVMCSLLFWGAMIRVTRSWAPPDQQGRAFGILESLRGVGEAATQSALLAVFVWLGASDQSLSAVIVQLSLIITALGVGCWFVVEDTVQQDAAEPAAGKVGFGEVLTVLRMPIVWLICMVVLATYSAYWTSFFFTPYATDVFLMSAAIAGTISVGRMWLKPVAALMAGFVADHFGIARSCSVLLLLLVVSFLGFSVLPGTTQMVFLMLVNIAIAAIAIFALRGIYFALLEEGGVPFAVTGTAAGVVSVVGLSPDIFMPIFGGMLLDAFPGEAGYKFLFLVTAAGCALGCVAAVVIYMRYVKEKAGDTVKDESILGTT